MTTARVQHIYNPKSGLAEDQMVNTWYFESIVGSDPLDTAAQTALAGWVHNFYNNATHQVRSNIAEVQLETFSWFVHCVLRAASRAA
jgi:hypothetical protein